ncbi:MAG: tetratricopeptide repeat protein [Bdellovibrionales bacterium]|nr:tetratricopeptide repeat protein [Bdellovibrionales bacterium]
MKIKNLLIFLFFVYSGFPFAEFIDEDDIDEDEAIEESSQRDNEREERRASHKKQQMKEWLKQLDSLKKSNKKEDVLLALTSKILNEDPDNIQALNTLGVFYLNTGKIPLAKIIFTRALTKHPENSSLHNNLGVIALKEGTRKEAMEAFQKSLSYRYSNYASAANLGTLYMQAYEYDLALDHLSLAYSRARQYLSLTHYEVVKTGNNYAVALAWSGKFRKARNVFEELVKNNPSFVELLLNYAILLGRDLEDKDKAYSFLNKADLMDKSGRYARDIKALKEFLKKGKAVLKGTISILARYKNDRSFYLSSIYARKLVFHKGRGESKKSLKDRTEPHESVIPAEAGIGSPPPREGV